MFNKNLLSILLIFACCFHANAQCDCTKDPNKERQFFKMDALPTDSKALRPAGNEGLTDSDNLQGLIDTAPEEGRVIKLLPSGDKKTFYFKSVQLKSNIHIRVHHQLTLKTNRKALVDSANATMFAAGNTGGQISNFSISVLGEDKDKRFAVSLRQLGSTDKRSRQIVG